MFEELDALLATGATEVQSLNEAVTADNVLGKSTSNSRVLTYLNSSAPVGYAEHSGRTRMSAADGKGKDRADIWHRQQELIGDSNADALHLKLQSIQKRKR